jgi:flagellar hook-associated protein 2
MSATVESTAGGSNVLSGLSSGIDTTAIVNELIAVNSQPQQLLQGQSSADQAKLTAYQALNTALQSLQTDADLMSLSAGWQAFAATSSSPTVATATAGSGTIGGSLTFRVNNLATSSSLVSAGTVSSTTSTVLPTGTTDLLLSEASSLGFASLGGTGLAPGAHTLSVTAAPTAASVTGTALPSTTSLATSATLSYSLSGGATKQLTVAAGSYTPAQLASAVAAASGGDLTAQADSSGDLVLSTTAQGGGVSLTIQSGTDAAFGLTAGQTGAGQNGTVTLDGTAATITSTSGPQTLSFGTAGTLTATFGGPVATGTTTLTDVQPASGSLTDVVNAINGAGADMTATAVQVGASSYRLQITSGSTGAAGTLTLDPSAFAGGTLGSLQTLQQGQDASITIGSGSAAYTVTSATDSVTGVMPGVTIDLASASTTPVTISTTPDSTGLAAKVQKIVDDINSVINQTNGAIAFDPNNPSMVGPLVGDFAVEGLIGGLTEALTNTVGSSSLQDGSAVGFSLNKDGTIAFDQAKFKSAITTNPSAVQALFENTNGDGIAQRLKSYADSMSNPATGVITAAIQGTQTEMTTLTDEINSWQTILDQQRQTLTNQFNNMETVLARLRAQSSALGF